MSIEKSYIFSRSGLKDRLLTDRNSHHVHSHHVQVTFCSIFEQTYVKTSRNDQVMEGMPCTKTGKSLHAYYRWNHRYDVWIWTMRCTRLMHFYYASLQGKRQKQGRLSNITASLCSEPTSVCFYNYKCWC